MPETVYIDRRAHLRTAIKALRCLVALEEVGAEELREMAWWQDCECEDTKGKACKLRKRAGFLRSLASILEGKD